MRSHLPGLHVEQDGSILIQTQDDLDQLLACPVHDLSTEMVSFEAQHWMDQDELERSNIAGMLDLARRQVCDEGRLPAPRAELPPIGTRVEAVVASRKPGPDCRYGIGTVVGCEWCCVTQQWRTHVVFDEPAGTHYGMPIRGTSTFVDFIYVIGDPTRRAWSSMTPDEIDRWLESRCL